MDKSKTRKLKLKFQRVLRPLIVGFAEAAAN